ncbi:RNA polymerase sigma factor [Bacillus solimangrovi]|uniref:RNA polymerase subunit sigma-70 n=1 Tax=Bacillus solimangrovi TaxID=1305675 RepID=A0A1E5LJM8_9BACI|nr:sigma-70 family RNA polymerase sigma factor [Bacillus solimangrovi]OEH94290.1 RNA polymerase subunit sigma-70 [Bacillus solimangrovi]
MFKNKNENVIKEFVIENKEHLYRFAYSYVKNSEDALDIVQDSIHKALKKQDSLHDPKTVKSWVYRIVVNTALDFLRTRKKVQLSDNETLEFLIPGKPDVYSNLDLKKALTELSAEDQTLITLRFFEDLKITEIAEILDMNVNTTKTRLYKILDILKKKLADSTGGM